MKAQMESGCVVSFGGVKGGKVQKSKAKAKEEANAQEIKEYLEKLQEIVPLMPKNKRMSKVEVIEKVIDYIHLLRENLGLPPCPVEDDLCSLDCSEMEHEEDYQVIENVEKKVQIQQESRAVSGEE